MRNVPPERIRIRSLDELDALVGNHVTGEQPVSRWEDRRTQFVFATVEDAIEAIDDPYYGSFVKPTPDATAVLNEIKEYRRYSTDLKAAWDVVERVSSPDEPLRVGLEGTRWVVNFGDGPTVIAPTAPVAICVAALQVKGVKVELPAEIAEVLA